ncbi:GNAT family N-acetyltransferase [Maribellus maritimus]|uniref:GNAT family N-acetyltransferase n=1 Tax=Maribellus maritimus TaxID=2870838 RepID=UPI001EECC390|nr:GNAT family N-acetyltransferase [Maribellus maritimus]MCG6186948.1 GNAT family N-acetyltransferase [Maribellus maritimus]
MDNLVIKPLTHKPVKLINQVFNDAFSDYEVQIAMPLERLLEMIKTRDLKPEYSMGCFKGDRLVGFILTGFREIDGKKYAYDGGTGVVKNFRRKGIGEKLLFELIGFLKKKQFSCLVLEVLENNTPAIKLYTKHGFVKTRRLECFEIPKKKLPEPTPGKFLFSHDISLLQQLTSPHYSLFEPTWQNSFKSILNVSENYQFSALTKDNHVLAFGFIHKIKGDIPQIGILNNWKNKGLEKSLITDLAQFTLSEKIRMLNVEENNYLTKKLPEINFENMINQFEMIFRF